MSSQKIADLNILVSAQIGKAKQEIDQIEAAGKRLGASMASGLKQANDEIRMFDQNLTRMSGKAARGNLLSEGETGQLSRISSHLGSLPMPQQGSSDWSRRGEMEQAVMMRQGLINSLMSLNARKSGVLNPGPSGSLPVLTPGPSLLGMAGAGAMPDLFSRIAAQRGGGGLPGMGGPSLMGNPLPVLTPGPNVFDMMRMQGNRATLPPILNPDFGGMLPGRPGWMGPAPSGMNFAAAPMQVPNRPGWYRGSSGFPSFADANGPAWQAGEKYGPNFSGFDRIRQAQSAMNPEDAAMRNLQRMSRDELNAGPKSMVRTAFQRNLEDMELDQLKAVKKHFGDLATESRPFTRQRQAISAEVDRRDNARFDQEQEQRQMREEKVRTGRDSAARQFRYASQNLAFGFEDALISYQLGGLKAATRAASNNVSALAMLIPNPAAAAGVIVGSSVIAAGLPLAVDAFTNEDVMKKNTERYQAGLDFRNRMFDVPGRNAAGAGPSSVSAARARMYGTSGELESLYSRQRANAGQRGKLSGQIGAYEKSDLYEGGDSYTDYWRSQSRLGGRLLGIGGEAASAFFNFQAGLFGGSDPLDKTSRAWNQYAARNAGQSAAVFSAPQMAYSRYQENKAKFDAINKDDKDANEQIQKLKLKMMEEEKVLRIEESDRNFNRQLTLDMAPDFMVRLGGPNGPGRMVNQKMMRPEEFSKRQNQQYGEYVRSLSSLNIPNEEKDKLRLDRFDQMQQGTADYERQFNRNMQQAAESAKDMEASLKGMTDPTVSINRQFQKNRNSIFDMVDIPMDQRNMLASENEKARLWALRSLAPNAKPFNTAMDIGGAADSALQQRFMGGNDDVAAVAAEQLAVQKNSEQLLREMRDELRKGRRTAKLGKGA